MTQAQTNSSRIGYPNLANLQQSSNLNQSADSNDRSFAEVFDELALQTTSRFSSQDTQQPVHAEQPTRQDRASNDRISQDRAADHAFENFDQNTIGDFQTQQPIQQGVQIRQLRFSADQKFLPGSYIHPVVPQQNDANNRASVIAFPEQSIVVPEFSATEAVINTAGQLNPAPTLDQVKNAVDPLLTINDAKRLSLGKTPTNDIDEAIQSLIDAHRQPARNSIPNQTIPLIRPTESEVDQVLRTDPLKNETIDFEAPFPVLKYPLGQSGLQPVNEKTGFEGKVAKAFDVTASEPRLARLKDHQPSPSNKLSPVKSGQFALPTSLREGTPQSKVKLNPTEIVDTGLPSEAGIENAVTLLQSIVATLVGSQNVATVDNAVAGRIEDLSNGTTSNINPAVVNAVHSPSQQTSGQATDYEATGTYRPGALPSDDQTNYHRLLLDRIAQAFESRQQGSAPVRFRLNVPKLGMIDIDIQISQSNISAAISAESSVTRQLVADNLPELRQRLSQQGINEDSLNIRVVTPADNESAADDSGGQSGQQFPKSPRLPRVARDNDLYSFSQQLEQVDLDVINVHV